MPLVARGQYADLVSINHNSGLTVTDECSTDVFVEGLPVHRQGDLNVQHSTGSGTHATPLAGCSSTVFANGIGVGRMGDLYSCGAIIAIPTQATVFAG